MGEPKTPALLHWLPSWILPSYLLCSWLWTAELGDFQREGIRLSVLEGPNHRLSWPLVGSGDLSPVREDEVPVRWSSSPDRTLIGQCWRYHQPSPSYPTPPNSVAFKVFSLRPQ